MTAPGGVSERHSHPVAEAVCAALARARVSITTEAQCQADVMEVLSGDLPFAVSREHRLGPADRPDFLVDGRVAVECKAKGSHGPSCLRQLERYARHDQVEALVLAYAGKALAMPAEIGGKPVFVIGLGRAWL